MFKESDLHGYQLDCINFFMQSKKCAFFVEMGLGKTVTSLTCVKKLKDEKKVKRILIVAPLKVAKSNWDEQAGEWEHLKNLSFTICVGTISERTRLLKNKSDITVINLDVFLWLMDNYEDTWDFDMLIIDESSKFKNPKGKTFITLKKFLHKIKYIILLTGTPTPNSLIDLWSQIYILDKGERLGKHISAYKAEYFNATGYKGYKFEPKPGAFNAIMERIKNMVISLKSEDHIKLPDKINITKKITLPKDIKLKYDNFKKEYLLKLSEEKSIPSVTEAVLVNKLLQICNGGIYDEEKNYHHLHDKKIEALREIIDDNPDENFLVAFNFNSDKERLMRAFPKALFLSNDKNDILDWNLGIHDLMFAHPASAGHGLNLQKGGNNIIWFGLTWSLELYQQFNARLYRQGQKRPVKIIHLVSEGCIDEKIMKVITKKDINQNKVMEFLKLKDII